MRGQTHELVTQARGAAADVNGFGVGGLEHGCVSAKEKQQGFRVVKLGVGESAYFAVMSSRSDMSCSTLFAISFKHARAKCGATACNINENYKSVVIIGVGVSQGQRRPCPGRD